MSARVNSTDTTTPDKLWQSPFGLMLGLTLLALDLGRWGLVTWDDGSGVPQPQSQPNSSTSTHVGGSSSLRPRDSASFGTLDAGQASTSTHGNGSRDGDTEGRKLHLVSSATGSRGHSDADDGFPCRVRHRVNPIRMNPSRCRRLIMKSVLSFLSLLRNSQNLWLGFRFWLHGRRP